MFVYLQSHGGCAQLRMQQGAQFFQGTSLAVPNIKCGDARTAHRAAAVAGLTNGSRKGYERVLRYPDGKVSAVCDTQLIALALARPRQGFSYCEGASKLVM